MRSKMFLVLVTMSLSIPTFVVGAARADESTVDKAKDTAGDAKATTKKTVRNGKQKVRKATGNDNALKDAKDKVNNVGDDVSNGAEKAERKAGAN